MRKPSHIEHLESCGRTYADLTAFRRQLESFRITVAWNTSRREWILGKVPAHGPTFISLRVGTESLAALMADAMDVARQFERRIAEA